MPYINMDGTPEGEKRCRLLNAKALAVEDQSAALFRDHYERLSPEAQADVAEYLRLALKVQRSLGLLRQSRAVLPSLQRMLSVVESINSQAAPAPG